MNFPGAEPSGYPHKCYALLIGEFVNQLSVNSMNQPKRSDSINLMCILNAAHQGILFDEIPPNLFSKENSKNRPLLIEKSLFSHYLY